MARSISLAALVAISLATAAAQAQQPDTGYELALSGPSQVRAGREASYRGVAYRVRGAAELVPYSGQVRARYRTEREEGSWIDVRPDARGRFDVAIPIAEVSLDTPRIEVEVGPDDAARAFEFPVSVSPAWDVVLRTDRVLYEPGEPVHVWLLARDLVSGAPAVSRAVGIELENGPLDGRSATLETSAAGVAYLRLDIPAGAVEGYVQVTARIDGAIASTSFRVGQRTWERMFAEIHITPEEVAPAGAATVRIHVTTPDAAPIRDATVQLSISEGESHVATTDAEGDVSIDVHAPAYLASETGYASVTAHVSHPAHGSVELHGLMRLAVPLALEVELVPAHGALIPEIDDVLYVRLSDALGDPPPAGSEVEVTSPAVAGGTARGRSDANGIVEIPVRLPRGASSGGAGAAQATFRVHVLGGPLARTARLSVPVQPAPEVAPSLARSMIEPGDPIEVRIARRPAAARLPVIVELLDVSHTEPLATVIAAPGAQSVRMRAPRGRLGVLAIRARAIHEDESLEGPGALAMLLVRPARPDFVSLAPTRDRWRVGETATVDLRTLAGAPRAWAALLVRDLAAHGGELDFHDYFLDRAFEQALLEASGADGERLVRAALAASAPTDSEPPVASPLLDALGLPDQESGAMESSPERGVLRDPWPLAREYARRGIGGPMSELESALASALEQGTLDEITEVRGASRRFRADLLDGSATTIGEGVLTPQMIEAVDPSFTYDAVARRVARVRLVFLLSALALYLDPGDEASIAARTAAREPWSRWLQRMVERGVITDEQLDDPWGGRFALRASRDPGIVLGANASDVELVSPGPDRRLGTADDVRDPFARVVPAGTPYAVASGEDALMRQLAVLSPADRTLAAIREAYRRISAEMTEDEIGDAVHASVSEGTIGLGGLGTVGYGAGGGGMGSGYGSGYGRAGSVGHGTAGVRTGGGNLARLVRERFPPTIQFRPEIAVDPSGTTRLEIPLADAVTSYRVEVIVWREDGWSWSARAQISSDRDVVIDAPIPDVARVGDRLSLPLRVQNRGDAPRELEVQLLGDDTIGVASTEPVRVVVAAHDAVEVPVIVAPSARGAGSLQVVARDAEGEPLDAVRRPIQVVAPARRVEVTAQALIEGHGELRIEAEPDADPRDGALWVAVGPALFDDPAGDGWGAWSGEPTIDTDPFATMPTLSGEAAVLGFAIGSAWTGPGVEDERIRLATERLATHLDASRGARTAAAIDERAWALLGLAPVARALDRRPALDEILQPLIERLAREVGDGATSIEDAPESLALSAAALAWSGGDRARARVAELVRRLDRSIVEVGEDVWVASPSRPLRATILLAMSHAATGDRDRAFELLATVARWSRLGHVLAVDEVGLARATARRIAEGTEAPTFVPLSIDGARRDVILERGRGDLDARELAVAGAHVIRVDGEGAMPIFVGARARYGVPWDRAPARAGPFSIAIEGVPNARDEIASLELVIANRSPRWITTPLVEIELPTGTELPEIEHRRIRQAVRSSLHSTGTLTLVLRPLPPGREARIPLPVRWTVAGTLRGFGVAAHAADRPDAISVLAPAAIPVAAEGGAR